MKIISPYFSLQVLLKTHYIDLDYMNTLKNKASKHCVVARIDKSPKASLYKCKLQKIVFFSSKIIYTKKMANMVGP